MPFSRSTGCLALATTRRNACARVARLRSFFATRVEPLKRNQFGAVLSGPVYLPKIYNGKNRTFFFGSYEGLRQDLSETQIVRVPSRV